jgi:GT2 family glycosyltransferase
MNIVSIISVNYNQPKVTVEFLRSVRCAASQNKVEMIIVDNGSRENHEATFREVYPNLVYIRSDENLGFAGGNNLGILQATGDYVLFLNNDTEVTANMIDILVNEFSDNPDIGLLSPLILYYDDKNTIQYAGYSKMNYLTARNSGQAPKNNSFNYSQETSFIHGAAMMCRMKDLKEVGLMEENYFLYYEELDWCEKFRKAGKKMWFTAKTYIYHKESISVGKESPIKTYFMHRNRMLFIRKNTTMSNSLMFSLYYVLLATPRSIFRYCLDGRLDLIPWVLRAIAWNLTNRKDSKVLGFKVSQS